MKKTKTQKEIDMYLDEIQTHTGATKLDMESFKKILDLINGENETNFLK